jgi:CRISPR system Cascade subunit CasA
MYDLLNDPIFEVRHRDNLRRLSLPTLVGEIIAKGEPFTLTRCRPFQRPVVHSHLVQLLALVLHRGDRRELPCDPSWWADRLSAYGEYAFHLTAPLGEAAFLQPATDGIEGWVFRATPDDIDALNTSPNHGTATNRRMTDPSPEHWVYALMSLQGQSSTQNYHYPAESRVPSTGRVFVGIMPAQNWGQRVVRDVQTWLREWDRLCDHHGYSSSSKGVDLLWTYPWDTPLKAEDLSPAYIGVCRRIRVQPWRESNRLVAYLTPCGARLPKTDGLTGDIWAPTVEVKAKGAGNVKRAVMRLTSSGFDYQVMQQILFGDSTNPALQSTDLDGDSPVLIAAGIARDQGKTLGFHQRILPIPPTVAAAWNSSLGLANTGLGALSIKFVQAASKVREALLAATSVLDASTLKRRLTQEFNSQVDSIFFTRLFEGEGEVEEREQQWVQELWLVAEELLNEKLLAYPLPTYRRWVLMARAKSVFHRKALKALDSFPRRMPEVMLVPANTINQVVQYLSSLDLGERKRIQRADSQASRGLPGTPGVGFFTLVADLQLDPFLWRFLFACFAHRPELHDPRVSLGEAIANLEPHRDRNKDSSLLQGLLHASGKYLEDRVRLLARRLAKARQPYDFGQLASLVVYPRGSKGDQLRIKIAEDHARN